MNTITHFLAAYLLGKVIFKKEYNHYLPFFCAVAGIIPDIDEFLHIFIPLEPFKHAVFTHTIIGGLLVVGILVSLTWIIGKNFLRNVDINLKTLFFVALIGLSIHLILDIFTYREEVLTTDAHLYFWPLSNFSFHLNGFFHQSVFPDIYTIRILIEVIFTAIIGFYLLFYMWAYKKENPFLMFSPAEWLKHISDAETREKNKKTAYILFAFDLGLIAIMASSLFVKY